MRDVPGLVDTRSPVEWGHPLNRGLVSWWMGLPNRAGGSALFDLTWRNSGTFSSGPTWAGNGRFPAVSSPGSGTGKVETAAGVGLPTGNTEPWAIVLWHRTRTNVSLCCPWGFGGQPDTTSTGTAAQRHFLYYSSSYYFWGAGADWSTGIAWDADNAWHHVVFTTDGTTIYFYRDGVQRASTTKPSFNTAGTYVSAVTRHPSGNPPDMDFGHGQIFSRRLGDSDVAGLYDQALRGYPGTIRRYVPRVYSFGMSAGGTTTQNLSGSSTATGSLVKAVSKPAAGSGTASGACGKLAAKPFAGSSEGAATLGRLAAKALAGSSTGTGAETRVASKALAGSSTGTGAVAKSAAKGVSGSSTGTGSCAKSASKPLAGSEAGTGAVAKAVAKPLAGSETASGGITNTNVRTQALAGSSAPTGTETRSTGKGTSGSTTGTGACGRSASKPLAGSATGAGSLAKQANNVVAGSSTPSGSLSAVRAVLRALAGAVTATGAIAKAALKYLVGRVTGSGSLATSGGSEPVEVETPGGTYRRRGDLSRKFRRLDSLSRVFRGYTRVADQIQYDTLVKDASETVSFLFDFSRFTELKDADQGGGGETLGTPVVDSVAGLTIGTPEVTTEDRDRVPAGKGIKVAISGGTANTTYSLECRGTTSGGAIRVVKGKLVVE